MCAGVQCECECECECDGSDGERGRGDAAEGVRLAREEGGGGCLALMHVRLVRQESDIEDMFTDIPLSSSHLHHHRIEPGRRSKKNTISPSLASAQSAHASFPRLPLLPRSAIRFYTSPFPPAALPSLPPPPTLLSPLPPPPCDHHNTGLSSSPPSDPPAAGVEWGFWKAWLGVGLGAGRFWAAGGTPVAVSPV